MANALLKNKLEETFDDVRERQFRARPAASQKRERFRIQREVVLALVRLRKFADLTQRELAVRAQWDTGYVSRLESVNGNPDLATIARYVEACGFSAKMAFGKSHASGFRRIELIDLTAVPVLADHHAVVAAAE